MKSIVGRELRKLRRLMKFHFYFEEKGKIEECFPSCGCCLDKSPKTNAKFFNFGCYLDKSPKTNAKFFDFYFADFFFSLSLLACSRCALEFSQRSPSNKINQEL